MKIEPYIHCPTDQLEYYRFEKINDWSEARRLRINAPIIEILERLKLAATREQIAKQLLEMSPLRGGDRLII
jgi:hypothetical protein